MARRIWNGSNGSWSTPSNWSPNGVPQRGDLVFIMGGKVDANGVNLKGESITIDAVSANAMTSLSIENSDFGPGNYTSLINGAYLILNNSNVYGTLVATQGGGQITVPAESVASNHGWWG